MGVALCRISRARVRIPRVCVVVRLHAGNEIDAAGATAIANALKLKAEARMELLQLLGSECAPRMMRVSNSERLMCVTLCGAGGPPSCQVTTSAMRAPCQSRRR